MTTPARAYVKLAASGPNGPPAVAPRITYLPDRTDRPSIIDLALAALVLGAFVVGFGRGVRRRSNE